MERKVVFVGTPGSGVTTFLFRIQHQRMPDDECTPYVMDNIHYFKRYEGNDIVLSFWDTAGHEEYSRLRPLTYIGAEVFVLCYSFRDPASISNISSKWFHEVQNYEPYAHIVVLGLQNSDINAEIPAEIQQFITTNGIRHFIADSPTGNGIQEFILGLLETCVSNTRHAYNKKTKKHEGSPQRKDFCRI